MENNFLIFDFDGTIANTEDFHWFAWNDILASYGVFLTDDHIRKYISNHDYKIIEMIEHDFQIKIDNYDDFIDKRLKNFINKQLNKVKAYDYFLNMNKENYCIVSNQKAEVIKAFFAFNNLKSPTILSALDMVVSKEKLLENTIKCNRNVIVFEDSNKYLKLAKSYGAKAIGIEHKWNIGTLIDADEIIKE